jgi:opacity protein-like surface antigen
MKGIIRISAVLAALSSTPAVAADIVSAAAPDAAPAVEAGWTYSVTPYFWAAGLSGEASEFGLPVIDIDASFSDIFDNLDFAAMLIGEARNGPYSLFGDLIYTKLSSGSATPRGVLATSVDVEASTFAGLAGAGYSVFEGQSGRLDVVGGVRVWSVDTDISFSGAFLDGETRSDGATWVDGLVGLRGNYAFTPQLYVMGWGLIGAGGADVDWDVMAGVGYNINETFSATLGYRALGVDYSDDGFLFDVVQQGPIAGLTIRF